MLNFDLPINEFKTCYFDESQEDSNLFILMKNIYEKIIGSFLGGVAEILAKIYDFVVNGLEKVINAISKIATDGGKELNSLIDEYIVKPLADLLLISSNPFVYLSNKIYNIFQDINIPLPSITLFNITLIKGNKAYDDLISKVSVKVDNIEDWVSKKFNGLIDFIVSFIKIPIEWIVKEIDKLNNMLSNIFSELVNDTAVFFKKLADWFLGLISPLNNLIDNILNLIVKWFVKSEEEISKVILYLKEKILELLTNFSTDKFSSILVSIDENVNPYIKVIFRFIVCSIKSLLKIIEYLFTFKFL